MALEDFNPLSYVLPESSTTSSNDPNYANLLMRERMAKAMMGSAGRKEFPDTFGKGLTYLGESLGDRFAEERMLKMLAAQQSREAQLGAKAPPSRFVPPPDDNPPPTATTSQDDTSPVMKIARQFGGWDDAPWRAL